MGKRYFNNGPYVKSDITVWGRIKHFIKSFWASKYDCLLNRNSRRYFGGIDARKWFYIQEPLAKSHKPVITWIGQSTFLIQIDGINILTDPVFSGINFFFTRNFKPGIPLKKLPKIDYIIISHNHADHMDRGSLLLLKSGNPKILVPKGDKDWFDYNNFENVYEMEWWQEEGFDQKIKFSFLPAIHWSGYNPWIINKALWGSWMIEVAGFKFYFAGDSCYANHFSDINKKFGKVDVAFLPIGPDQPRELVKHSHMDSIEAVDSFLDLKAKHFIPMHWGTFRIDGDRFFDPINKLQTCWDEKKEALKESELHILKFGKRKEFEL